MVRKLGATNETRKYAKLRRRKNKAEGAGEKKGGAFIRSLLSEKQWRKVLEKGGGVLPKKERLWQGRSPEV